MSLTRTLEIQRLLGLDEPTMVTLRNFDVDWSCGTRLILALIKNVVNGVEVSETLKSVMFDYKILCHQGISDYERLYYVLSSIFDRLHLSGKPLTTEQVSQLCTEASVPPQIMEQLLNG
ncbi:hypothetical protein R2571_005695 [Pseudomonas aeruginosa]|jgi:hypothetical protein|nr:hypothetical protein [Pseudomonas aeruginosa]